MSLQVLHQKNKQLADIIKQGNNTKLESNEVKQLLKQLKILIFSTPNIQQQSKQFLVQARKFSQLNLFHNLATDNTKAIQISIQGLRFFYQNQLQLNTSENFEAVLAIHLLFLLSVHRNQDFYTKLQNLTTQQIHYNYVQYVLKINQAIQQGNYRKVFQLKNKSPLNYFSSFLNKIGKTIRIQIAKSAQKAYQILTIDQALQIFQLKSQSQLRQFIDQYSQNQNQSTVNWSIQNGILNFNRTNSRQINFNSDQIIKTALFYSEQLQRIA